MAINPEDQQSLIDRLVELFQSNEATIEFGDDPDAWVDENLPEGTEAADVAGCMPEVGERLGGPYQQNLGHYNAGGAPVTHSVVNEISYTYNTVYQQNAFIYAEEGAQVTNIQGDGNTVNQVQVDNDFGVETPEDHEDPDEAPEAPEAPTDPVDPGWEDPMDHSDPEPETDPVDEAPEVPDVPEDMPEA